MNQGNFLLREEKQFNPATTFRNASVLRNEIAPHFVVNALMRLPLMIQRNPENAVAFTKGLAMLYRDVLEMGSRDIVPLSKDMDLLASYVNLLKIDFNETIKVRYINNVTRDLYIVPVSLQLLMENAVKHNYFSDGQPLVVEISNNDKYLRFSNRIKHKEYSSFSSKKGLKNLEARCLMSTGRSIKVEESRGEFTVYVPLTQLNYA